MTTRLTSFLSITLAAIAVLGPLLAGPAPLSAQAPSASKLSISTKVAANPVGPAPNLVGAPAVYTNIVDTTMTAPGQTSTFSGFYSPIISASNVAFEASYQGGLYGLYTGVAGATGATRIVDYSMTAPGQSTAFLNLSGLVISGSNVAFVGYYSGNGLGIYTGMAGTTGATRITDTSMTTPPAQNSLPAISGSNLTFLGYSPGGIYGIYTGLAGTTGVTPVVDVSMTAPGQSTVFGHLYSPVISGNNVAFLGYPINGGGIYTAIAGTTGAARIADATTTVPGQSTTFSNFDPPVISGSNVAFLGRFFSTSGEGIYTGVAGTTGVSRIVDTSMTAPGQSTLFSSFSSPVISGSNVAFLGTFSSSGEGIYTGVAGATGATRIADTSMTAPGQSTLFSSFGDYDGTVSVSGTNVAFVGKFNSGQGQGIFLYKGGTLIDVAETGESLFGGTIFALSLSSSCLDGNKLTFQYQLNGGVQGIATFVIPTPTGVAYACGLNSHGQLGNNSTDNSDVFVPVNGLSSGVTAIAAGGNHSLAIQNGAVYAWGWNSRGQLGNNSTTDSPVPVAVSGLASGVTAVAGGDSHSLAIQNGAAYAWGDNDLGQLGNNSTTASSVPVAVSGLFGGVTAVAGGFLHSLAIQNGAAYAWGYNRFGQLGNNSTTDSSVPAPVTGLSSGVTAVAASQYFSLAIQNGAVYSWGYGQYGELGNNSTAGSHVPVPVTGLSSGVTAIAVGAGHGLAVQNGAVYAWGDNEYGQLGNGSSLSTSSVPVAVSSLSNITAVAACDQSSFALASDGSLWVWGENPYGELGLGDFSANFYTTPQQLLPPSGYRYSALDGDAGGDHVVALLTPVPIAPTVTTTQTGPGAYSFAFATQAAMSYQLQRSGDLSTWTNVGSPITGDGSVKTLSDTSSATSMFWRVSVQAASN